MPLTIDQLKKDLIGESIYINDDFIEITEDNLAYLSIKEIKTKSNSSRVLADIWLEELGEEAGERNKQKRKNHIHRVYKGELRIDYERFEKYAPWMIMPPVPKSAFSYEETEVPNFIDPVPPLEKSEEGILHDLQTQYTGSVMVKGSGPFGHLAQYVSFDRTNSERTSIAPVKKVHSFSSGIAGEGSFSLERIMPIELSFDFDVENASDMYEQNGSYRISGSMNVIYTLLEDDEAGGTSWMITDVDTENANFTIEKL
ncbi:hypothetical protein L2D08_12685 [Domibacillus sp. PGB-M46]|uniref:hypothetical protein n=1 Tax=Domibacillus sp. PGB-M46 TaxID=2910255 RepID=UPI001F59A7C2|nr:hypothetical protein [Domibacillus sp. PGB-M46]MCI2255223.1 hypothetical protein [Domibacillus sp. PGB-M46]